MENFKDIPVDDDPYCLDDEPKRIQDKHKYSEEVTIVNIDFKTIEDEIGKNVNLCVF